MNGFEVGRNFGTLLLTLCLQVLCASPAVAASTTTITGTAQLGPVLRSSTFTALPGNAEFALRLSTGLFISSGPIQFADGSTQSSAFVPSSNSTSTIIPQQAVGSSIACLAGSTITLTMGSNDTSLGIFGSGTASSNITPPCSGATPCAGATWNVLMDGALFADFPDGTPIMVDFVSAAGTAVSFFVMPRKKGLKGQHQLCLRAYSNNSTSFTVANSSSSKMIFGAYEIK